ncbi:MAG: glycosyltransferase [Phycisphaerales bacterium]|nr:glycosyltransferase [Phycisphaerales bacterium]
MDCPRVSVIIPTYNRLGFLREALDSVHAQTFSDYEVIIVDDGSTEDIAAGVADHPVKSRIVRQVRSGPGAARNRGIDEASADTIAFLDSDDLWAPTKLARFLQVLDDAPEIRIAYGPMLPIDAERHGVPGRTKPCHDGRITTPLFLSSFVHVPTVVCRKSTIVEIGGFDPNLPVCEDYDLWLRLSVFESFALVEEPLAYRRLHGDRLSKSSMARNLSVKADVLRRFRESDEGRRLLPKDIADERLARVYFVAAREAKRAGRYDQAMRFCQESRRFGGSAFRTLPVKLGAGVMRTLRGAEVAVEATSVNSSRIDRGNIPAEAAQSTAAAAPGTSANH